MTKHGIATVGGTDQVELTPNTVLKPRLVEIEHSVSNTSIACIKNTGLEIPENIQKEMDKRRIALANDLHRKLEVRLTTRPTLAEVRLRRTLAQKMIAGVNDLDLAKLKDLRATRDSNLQFVKDSLPIQINPAPFTEPRDTTNDLMMWWGQTSVINMPGGAASFSFEDDGLHLAADVEAHDGSAHDSSFTVLAQFYLDGARIFPKRTSGVTPYTSVPPVEFYGAVWGFTSTGGSVFDWDFGDHWAKLYLNSTQNVFINSQLRAGNNENRSIVDFVDDGDWGWSGLPGPYNMPQVNFDANQLDSIEIDLIFSLDFIVEGDASTVTVGRRALFDYALLRHPQWKIIQTGG